MRLWEDAYLASGGDIKSVMEYYLHHTKGGKQNQLLIIENLRRVFGEKMTKPERNLTILMEGLKNLFAGYAVDEDRIKLLESLMHVFSKSEMQQRGILLSRELWERARKNLSTPRAGLENDVAVERFDEDGQPLQLQPHHLHNHIHHEHQHEGHSHLSHPHHDPHALNTQELHLNALPHDVMYSHHHPMTAEDIGDAGDDLPAGHGLKRAHEVDEVMDAHFLGSRGESREEDDAVGHSMDAEVVHHAHEMVMEASGKKRRKLH